MTPEEIKKIAYYICERRHKEEETSENTTFIFPIDIYADIVSKLSERYCIVPKSKVKEEYDFWFQHLPKKCNLAKIVQNDPDTARMWGKIEVLDELFGKDMFEEEGK